MHTHIYIMYDHTFTCTNIYTYVHTYINVIYIPSFLNCMIRVTVHPAVYYYMKRHRLYGFSSSYVASIAQPWSFLAAGMYCMYVILFVCMYVCMYVCIYVRTYAHKVHICLIELRYLVSGAVVLFSSKILWTSLYNNSPGIFSHAGSLIDSLFNFKK